MAKSAAQKRWEKRNPEKIRQWKRDDYRRNQPKHQERSYFRSLKKFGVTKAQYLAMNEKQGGLCAICRGPETRLTKTGRPTRLAVDHHHVTNTPRGLLCNNCNSGIGYFRENPKLLMYASIYLFQWRKNISKGDGE